MVKAQRTLHLSLRQVSERYCYMHKDNSIPAMEGDTVEDDQDDVILEIRGDSRVGRKKMKSKELQTKKRKTNTKQEEICARTNLFPHVKQGFHPCATQTSVPPNIEIQNEGTITKYKEGYIKRGTTQSNQKATNKRQSTPQQM